jgi:hypothetical protein
MKKSAPKKMTLSRETLVTLTENDARAIVAGATGPCSNKCTTSLQVCCP